MRSHLTTASGLLLLLVLCLVAWVAAPLTYAATAPADHPETDQEAAPEEPSGEPEPEPGSAEMTPEEKADAEIGKSAAEAVEKQFDIVEDSPELPRLAAIIERLRPATQKPHQEYQVKIVESQALNAFALPGGYLYYTQGLLAAAESEDELAAITAHEMAHVCLSHSRKLMKRDDRYLKILGPLILASILTDSEHVDPSKIAFMGGLVVQDALNHYGREAELEADHHAVLYLKDSKHYNPVAVLTVVEGLAHIEGGNVPIEWGVAQTHPDARARVDAVIGQLRELDIPIERRRVTSSLVAEATSITRGDDEIGELRLNDRVVFQPAAELSGTSPVARAERSAQTLTSLLLADLQLSEILSVEDGDRVQLRARGQAILTIAPADADFHNSTVDALAEQAIDAVRLSFQEEKIQRAY